VVRDLLAGRGNRQNWRNNPNDRATSSTIGRFESFREQITLALQDPANAAEKGKTRARILRFHLASALFDKPTAFPVGSHSRILVDKKFPSTLKAFTSRTPDGGNIRAWGRILSPGDVFVDVGANAGLYSVMAADMGSQVVSVEPFPDCQRVLVANQDLNGFQFEIMPVALANDALIAQRGRTMTFTDDQGPRNHLLLQESSEGVQVPVMTLDEVIDDKVDRNRVVKGLKVDVEGAELLVLEGGVKAISAGRIKWIQLEYNFLARHNGFSQDRKSTKEFLLDHKYRLFRPDEDGVLFPSNVGKGGGRDIFAEYIGGTAV
jgi:FkbM family methyltransferase